MQEIYTEIIDNEELKKAYLEAAKGGKIVEFLKAQGCEATAEEIKAFLKEKADQPLSDAKLDNVAGGACNKQTSREMYLSLSTLGLGCATIAIVSEAKGYTGQNGEWDARLCNIPGYGDVL